MQFAVRWPLVLGLVLVTCLSGCAMGGSKVPKAFRGGEGARLRLDPATRAGAYGDALFPAGELLHVSDGVLRIRGGKLAGLERVRFSFFATDSTHMRFLAADGTRSVMDVIRRGDYLTVVLETTGDLIQGTVAPGEAPLAGALGWDPGDWVRVFMIGQVIAQGDFKAAGEPLGTELTPTSTTLGVESIRLDARTGLPVSLSWRNGEQRWMATYRGWKLFRQTAGGGESSAVTDRLRPSSVQIAREGSDLTLEFDVRGYELDNQIPRGIWTPIASIPLQKAPLSALGEALR